MTEEIMDLNFAEAEVHEQDQQEHTEGPFRTPPKRQAHGDGLPNANSRESSLLKKKLDSVLASTKRKLEAGNVKSKRNLLDDFEACNNEDGVEREIQVRKIKNDLKPKISTKKTATVTPPNSPSESPEASTSKAFAVKEVTEVVHRQLPERSTKCKEFNETVMSMESLKKALAEQENMEVMKIYRNKFVRRRSKPNAELKSLKAKPKSKKLKRPSQQVASSLEASGSSSNTLMRSSCKTYYFPEAEGHFDECPDIFLRSDGSAQDWDVFLEEHLHWGRLHSIEAFPLAPLKDVFRKWGKIGLVVEVPNLFAQDDNNNFPYWCGTIINFAGYKAIIQLQDLDTLPSEVERKKYRVYLSLFCGKVKPLNWASTNGFKLDPGPVVVGSINSAPLANKLDTFYSTSATISEAMMLEVSKANSNHDKSMFGSLDVIKFSGDRFVAKIVREDTNNNASAEPMEYYYHYKHRNVLPLIHGSAIGITPRSSSSPSPKRFKPVEPTSDTFPQVPEGIQIQVGMKLEVLNIDMPYVFSTARITEVYNYGYFEVETGGNKSAQKYRRVYHITDPHVLPIGFAAKYGMPMVGGSRFADCPPLDLSLMPARPAHGFDIGDKFEAAALVAPDFLGPVTVVGKSGHLVCVHFDGWSYYPINYQWIDPLQDEIYPSGYCETFGFDWKGNVTMAV